MDGFRFFYSKEGNEPAHIHVEHQDNEAKSGYRQFRSFGTVALAFQL
jgi:hypothetical protein